MSKRLEDGLAVRREVLGAHLTQGLKPEQIARRIDVAPGTVRVRLHRGLKRLRKAMIAAGHVDDFPVDFNASSRGTTVEWVSRTVSSRMVGAPGWQRTG